MMNKILDYYEYRVTWHLPLHFARRVQLANVYSSSVIKKDHLT